MFKLIKILNSGTNVPEPVKLPKPSTLSVKMGSALILADGAVANCTATAAPTYVAAQNAGTDAVSVLCYCVSENMLFETTVNAAPTALKLGDKVTLGIDADGSAVNVSATTVSGVATVVDLMGAASAGDKVTVKF